MSMRAFHAPSRESFSRAPTLHICGTVPSFIITCSGSSGVFPQERAKREQDKKRNTNILFMARRISGFKNNKLISETKKINSFIVSLRNATKRYFEIKRNIIKRFSIYLHLISMENNL